MHDLHTIAGLRTHLHETEHEAQQLRARVRALEERVELAEKAARDAWRFARGLMTGAPSERTKPTGTG
jgi:uncharacterized coiled-coil protein SlyX